MNNFRRAGKLAWLCMFTSLCKAVFCVVALLFSGEAEPVYGFPGYVQGIVGWAQISACVSVSAASLVVPSDWGLAAPLTALRRMGFALALRGATDLINLYQPREWHASWFGVFDAAFVVLSMLTMYFFVFNGPDDKPRKKRKLGAKLPAWVKRWSRMPRLRNPTPSPRPVPLK